MALFSRSKIDPLQLMRDGKFKKAIKVLELELGRNPDDFALRLRLAEAFEGADRFDDAIEVYREEGESCLSGGSTRQALVLFRKALKLRPDDEDLKGKIASIEATTSGQRTSAFTFDMGGDEEEAEEAAGQDEAPAEAGGEMLPEGAPIEEAEAEGIPEEDEPAPPERAAQEEAPEETGEAAEPEAEEAVEPDVPEAAPEEAEAAAPPGGEELPEPTPPDATEDAASPDEEETQPPPEEGPEPTPTDAPEEAASPDEEEPPPPPEEGLEPTQPETPEDAVPQEEMSWPDDGEAREGDAEPPDAKTGKYVQPVAAVDLLRELFPGLTTEDASHIGATLAEIELEPGDVLLKEGEPGDSLFLVREGTLEASARYDGANLNLGLLERCDVIGEVAFLKGVPRTATIMAVEPSWVLELSRTTVRDQLEQNPDLLGRLESILEERVNNTIELLKKSWADH